MATRSSTESSRARSSRRRSSLKPIDSTNLRFTSPYYQVATVLPRLRAPHPIEQPGLGLAISTGASLSNLGVARVLLGAGGRHGSIELEAGGHHLMTDVWTSVGVIGAVGAVAVTGWAPLVPLIALAEAANMAWTGVRIVRRSALGLVDRVFDPGDLGVLDRHTAGGVHFHAPRTRQAGARSFVAFHVLVPAVWSVARGHELAERIEAEIRQALPGARVLTHLEPVQDPASLEDGASIGAARKPGTDRVRSPRTRDPRVAT